jgi:hypothetical protein
LSENWNQTCQKILDQINQMSLKSNKDRLDLVQSMRFSLYALHKSIMGWLNWVNNPDIMVSFKHEELEKMNTKIMKFIEEFIKYDMEVTEKSIHMSEAIQKLKRQVEEKDRREADSHFYI